MGSEAQAAEGNPSLGVEVSRVFLRLATPRDVPHILALITDLARFEHLEHECVATEEKLKATIFDNKGEAEGAAGREPFTGPTVVMLEVGSGPAADAGDPGTEFEEALDYAPGGSSSSSSTVVRDIQKNNFISTYNPHRTVVAFALTFPNYSTFLARPGLYLEDLFVREEYRRCGFGTCLLRFLARVAHKQGMGRLEWSVLDWNEKAIQFYTQRMGARIMGEWRICRLEGPTLEAAAEASKF